MKLLVVMEKAKKKEVPSANGQPLEGRVSLGYTNAGLMLCT